MYLVDGGILLKILKTVAVSMHGFHLLVRVSFNYKNKARNFRKLIVRVELWKQLQG